MDATNPASSPVQPVATRLPLSPARYRAYRRLALTIVGMDVPTLTAQLLSSELSGPRLQLVATALRAA